MEATGRGIIEDMITGAEEFWELSDKDVGKVIQTG